MSLDLEMANAAISERKFGDAGTADDIERWRREVDELRRAIATVRDTALEQAENTLRRRAHDWASFGRREAAGGWLAAALVIAEMRREEA